MSSEDRIFEIRTEFKGFSLGEILANQHKARTNAEVIFRDFVIDGLRLSDPRCPYAADLFWPESPPLKAEFFKRSIRNGREPLGLVYVRPKTTGKIPPFLPEIELLREVIAFLLTRRDIRSDATVNIGLAMLKIRLQMELSLDDLAKKLGINRITLSRWESGSQMPSFGPFYRWLEALNLVAAENVNLVRVVDISSQIIPVFLKDPQVLFTLSAGAFEQLVAERLDKMGYNVALTGNANRKDGGIDIIGVPKVNGNYVLAAQVKHHKKGNKSGRGDVDRLLAWHGKPFALGMLVTNTGFTVDARWVAELAHNKAFLRLRGFEDLRKWMVNNFTGEAREIPDSIEVAPGILVRIPKPDLSSIFPPKGNC